VTSLAVGAAAKWGALSSHALARDSVHRMDWWKVGLGIAAVLVFAIYARSLKKTPSGQRKPTRPSGRYPGDFQGKVTLVYAPKADGAPDPGEIVWTWVPFQEDASKGKDRPVLLIGHDGAWLLGLMLTSKDHDHDTRRRENWLDIGAGSWDRQRRPSEVRLDRIIRVDPRAVRREGATVSRGVFYEVSHSLSTLHHW